MVTMQANALWAGNDYAYIHDRGNLTFSHSAARVRVMRVFKRKENTWSQRMKTYVDVIVLDDDGTPTLRDGSQIHRTVIARDIVSEWEEYADERDRRNAEVHERRRKQQEEAAKIAFEAEAIQDFLANLGLERGAVSFPYYNNETVSIRKEAILNWMKSASSV
jgi:hypothetical protein